MDKIVCLDAGHGGFDPGALGIKTKEKDNNLALVLKVGKILSQYKGVVVKYTRTTDTDFAKNVNGDLTNRVLLAKKYNPDVFVSCHNNAFNKKAVGIETFCHKFGGTDEKLARSIHDSMMAVLPFVDRKVKTKNLYVTKKWDGTKTSACLVEYGFIDSEEDKILANMDKAAEAIAKGILKFLGIKYQGNQPQSQPQGGNKKVEKAVLIFSQDDLPGAKRLQGKIGNCAIFFRNSDGTAPNDIKNVNQLFVVGGAGSVGHPNEVLLQGSNWFKTIEAVERYISGK